jgi:hypothetical protein
MRGGAARAHEKSPSVTKQKATDAMTLDKKPSTTEIFSTKLSQHVKNATPAMTSSLVAPAT